MKLFVCIYGDSRLLPHFLRHYARFGVTEFHVAAPPELANHVLRASSDYRVTHYKDLDVEDSVLGGAAAVSEMRRLAQGPEEWVVIVDLDEFVEFGEPVAQIITRLEGEGANVAQGVMFDRFAEDGQPKAIGDDTVIAELFPVRARFIKIVMKGFDRKAVLVKGHLKSRVAHHVFHDQKLSKTRYDISHYKWNDSALKRVRSAYEILCANQVSWAEEYKRILDHYDQNGRFAWEAFEGEFAADAVPSSSGAWAK